MTRRTALVWALAALGGGTLLWSAWRVLSTDLSTTGRVLAAVLWLLLAAAVVTFFLYARELMRQRVAITRGARWQPVPAVALLWLGGATSLVVFTALMPASAASAPKSPAASTRTPASDPASVAADARSAAAARTSATSSSRAQQRTPAATTTSAPAPRNASTPTPTSTTSLPASKTTSAPPSPTTTTTSSTPLIDITIPGKPVKPTKPPGH